MMAIQKRVEMLKRYTALVQCPKDKGERSIPV